MSQRDRHPLPDRLCALDENVLPPEMEREIREHLAACRVCARLREDLRHPALSEPTLADLASLRKRVLPGAAPRVSRWWMAAAAAVAAVAASLYFTQPAPAPHPLPVAQAPPPVFRLPLEPAPLRLPLASAVTIRGQREQQVQKYLEQLGAALTPYRAGKYGEAGVELERLAAEYPKAVEPPFYRGVAFLLAGDASAALGWLRKARAIGGEALDDDISWYLAIALERTGSWPQARPLLEALCRSEGPYRQSACEGARAQ